LPVGFPSVLKAPHHLPDQYRTPTGKANNNAQIKPESSNIMTENTQIARFIARSEEVDTRLLLSSSSETASKTCKDDSTKERLANPKIIGAIERSTHIPVDQ
jgi:hypothetical protein